MESAVMKYTGSAPGANTDIYPLFSSVTAFPGKRAAQNAGLKRIYITITHSANGSFLVSKSVDRGLNWHPVSTTAITFASGVSATLDRLIEEFDDFKIEWSNTSSSAQSPWVVSIALTDERSAAT